LKLTADVYAYEPSIYIFKTTANFNSFSSLFPVREDAMLIFLSNLVRWLANRIAGLSD
jgi:hypothetical protein